ncbi:hypothetical protein KV697_17675 [Sphingomonas sanguinis]|uniref:Uncharacterized protein n=1 Tax=Sphingomonas sanguinis TaxID=33051 RepID=A0ABU5LPG2_9SPHN|nr:hypothetical protein [Sphingomonas sanguinis]MDZ7281833.1 hypothetical protein [Sphingomonas sanguinis]QXT35531.1 hypothetical protein KV697_17675 [Sphingomonas sanguinis]
MAKVSIGVRGVASCVTAAILVACLPLGAQAVWARPLMGGGGGQGGCPAAPASGGDAMAIGALAAAVCAEVTRLPKGASTDDLEAAMVFAVSQAASKPALIVAALDRLAGADLGQQNFPAALKRVRDAYANQRVRRGTAAVNNGVAFSGGFTTPSLAGGGGSSNYTR